MCTRMEKNEHSVYIWEVELWVIFKLFYIGIYIFWIWWSMLCDVMWSMVIILQLENKLMLLKNAIIFKIMKKNI